MQLISDRLMRNFQLWEDMARHLPEEAFSRGLPLPSNSIGSQFWCLVGARESYTRALASAGWQGFSCSLGSDDISRPGPILEALHSSGRRCLDTLNELEWDEVHRQLQLDLLEHEVQHMGQLIRYCYGLGYGFPESWKRRWSLG